MSPRWPLAFLLPVMLLLLLGAGAQAHTASTSYLRLAIDGDEARGALSLAIRDLANVVLLDPDGDGAVLWSELDAAGPQIDQYIAQHLALSAAGSACTITQGRHLLDRLGDGAYAYVPILAQCPPGDGELALRYDLFFSIDPTHRSLVTVSSTTGIDTFTLGPDDPSHKIGTAGTPPGSWQSGPFSFFTLGLHHLLLGPDHLLFLLVLLLPILVKLQGTAASESWTLLKILTAFTAAHGLSLLLAIEGWIDAPSRLVESGIALTIALTALDNLIPFLPGRRWHLAFFFGLIHGLGFASVLKPLALATAQFWPSFVSFNLGIEAGQIAVATAFALLLLAMRRLFGELRALVPAGSALALAAGLLWLVARATPLHIVGFSG